MIDEVFLKIATECGEALAGELSGHVQNGSVPDSVPKELTGDPDEPAEEKKGDLRSQLTRLTVAEKVKVAMFGNALIRKLLILDPNRLIQECVLNNPRLTPPEIEEFARSTGVDSQVLRAIAGRSVWMKSAKVKASLVCNPKCPLDVSLKWLKFLQPGEIKEISRSRNVPQGLQVAAKKLVG
jgi:hypothetical protein